MIKNQAKNKGKIYDENQGEVTRLLIDDRVDDLSDLIAEIQEKWKGGVVPPAKRNGYLIKLSDIAKRDIPGGQKLLGSRTPLEGLSLRAFNRWMTAHSILESDICVDRLLSEIAKSADSKLTKKLIAMARRFPRKRKIETAVMKMVRDKQIIFPHQEAECLRSLRYLSNLSQETMDHCWKRVTDKSADRYLRMESAYLLARTELSNSRIKKLMSLFHEVADPYVQVAIASLLVQRRESNNEIIQMLVFHPNEKIRDVGKLFRTVKNEPNFAKKSLRHALCRDIPWVICDNMPFLHLMAASRNREIRKSLLDSIREPRLKHPIGGVRNLLQSIFTRTRESLAGQV